VLKWFAYHGGPVVLDVVAPILLKTGAVHTEPVFAAKTKLLATLLTLPFDDASSFKLLSLCLQLIESTRIGGSDSESPLAGVSDLIVDQVTEILGDRVVEEHVGTESQTDVGAEEKESCEAA
jgi:hypothetical protein